MRFTLFSSCAILCYLENMGDWVTAVYKRTVLFLAQAHSLTKIACPMSKCLRVALTSCEIAMTSISLNFQLKADTFVSLFTSICNHSLFRHQALEDVLSCLSNIQALICLFDFFHLLETPHSSGVQLLYVCFHGVPSQISLPAAQKQFEERLSSGFLSLTSSLSDQSWCMQSQI